MAITVPTGGFSTYKLFLGEEDFSQYLVPESARCSAKLNRQVETAFEFHLKQMPEDYEIRGGQRVTFYLPNCETALFFGFAVETAPVKHSPSAWTYRVVANGMDRVFFRKHSYIALRNMTFEEAVNAILQDSEQAYPNIINTTVVNSNGVLDNVMPFYSASGVHPGELFSLIAELTNSAWRMIQTGADEFSVEFYDATTYQASRPFELSNTSQNFNWKEFQPTLSLDEIINSQTVRGAIVPATTEELALFRGDNLNSKFPLPVKPYNNILRIELRDSFDSTVINSQLWLEQDSVANKVYQTGDGFLQLEPAGEWVGVQSRVITERSNGPTAVFDITWVADGAMMMLGFTGQASLNTADPFSFLDTGIATDGAGTINLISNGSSFGSYTLGLSPSTQYRFRITAKIDGGCKLEYQAGSDIYTRNWTLMGEDSAGTDQDLQVVVFNKDADFNVADVKCTNPYLGIKLRVDRGQGFKEEFIGVYPIDDDLEAVIEDEQTVSFFGSNPGPSTIPPAPSAKTVTNINTATNVITVTGGHCIASGTEVRWTTVGTDPSGLVTGNTYFLHADSESLCTFYGSEAGALAANPLDIVDITTAGSGTHSFIPIAWEDKDSDYKNIEVTYHRGQRLQATYRDLTLIDTMASLFGNGDDGIREGATIVDEKLTSYEACLSRAQVEVENHNDIIANIEADTSWRILQSAGASTFPMPGDVARFSINVDATDYLIEGDIPIIAMGYQAFRGGNDFGISITAGYQEKGLRSILREMMDSGQLISVSDADLLYRSKFVTETQTLSDAASVGFANLAIWGDSRYDRTFTANAGTDLLTLNSSMDFVTGHPVEVSSTTTLPPPLVTGTTYFLNKQSSTTAYLYDTQANADVGGATGRVDISGAGSGTHTIVLGGWMWGNHAYSSFFWDTVTIQLSGKVALPTVT